MSYDRSLLRPRIAAVLGGALVLVHCADPGSTQPGRTASDAVRLSVAVEVAAAGRSLALEVGYARTDGSRVPLVMQQFLIATANQVPLAVDLAPCLADAAREDGMVDPRLCTLHVSVSLLGDAGQLIDKSELPPLKVRPGDVASAQLAVGGRTSFVQLAAGAQHTCRTVTTSGGATTCWGANAAGQLGDGTLTDRLTPTPIVGGNVGSLDFVQITAGWTHSCALNRMGTAVCWGDNSSGQIAVGGATSRSTPVEIATSVSLSQLVSGMAFNCGLGTDSLTYCWGANDYASLGDGTLASRSSAAAIKGSLKFKRLVAGGYLACGLTDVQLFCWGSVDASIPTPAVAAVGPVSLPGTEIVHVSSFAPGFGHACALVGDGQAMCVGKNDAGQLGDGTTNPSPVPVFVTGGLRFSTLRAGKGFTCGIASDGFTYCWGANNAGQLGDGTTTNHGVPTRVVGDVPFAVLAAGAGHVCAVTSSGATYCWGTNSNGQLGDGTKVNRLAPTAVK